jgi:hypothetical protein
MMREKHKNQLTKISYNDIIIGVGISLLLDFDRKMAIWHFFDKNIAIK